MDGDRAFRWTLLALAGVLTFLLLFQYLTVILGAILLAYLLGPAYRRLAPWIGATPAALGLIVVAITLVVVPFIILVSIAITGLTDLADRILSEERQADFATLNELLQEVYGGDGDLQSSIMEFVRDGQVGQVLRTLMDTLGSLSQAFISLTILLLLTYFLLVRGDDLVEWIANVLPLPESDRRELFERADDLMYAVVIGNVAIGVVDGVLVGIGLFLTGFTNVLFWTFMAIFAALIPIVGSMLVWVPAAAYLVVTGEVVPGALLFLYGGVFIGAVDNFLRPYVGAKQAELNPAFFIVGVFTGLALIGVMGLFYGPIILVMTKHVVDVVGPADAG